MQIRDNIIDEIKSRCNIVDVVGRVVQLKQAGSNYKGRCPFHNEKTPSFVVSETKQIFTCFGCGATGDVIEFVKKYYNLDFMQAIEKMADECGIQIETNYKKNEHKDEFYEINRQAARFFYKAMRSEANPGWDYMIGRGMDKDTLQKFGVGYADGNWDTLYKYLKNLGYKEEQLMEIGLISFSKGKYYDKFRNRVIFPIQNTAGKVIGFGGRIIGDGNPKYLNSQESSVFLKKNNLYGLNITRQDISKEDFGILVEGYMDVISLYQGGVRNVFASLGTSLTEGQARMLNRYTKNIILSYDSDNAGIAAALRGMDILHKEGFKVKVLQVDDGKDPDEFIKKRGKEAFNKLIKNAIPFTDYKFSVIKKEHNPDGIEGKVAFLEEAVKVLKELNPVESDIYIKKLSNDYDISQGAIRAQLENENMLKPPIYREIKKKNKIIPLSPEEKNIIKVLISESKYFEKEDVLKNIFTSEQGKSIYDAMKTFYTPGEELNIKELAYSLDEEDRRVLNDIQDNVLLAGNTKKIFDDCVEWEKRKMLEAKEKMLIAKLSMADENENSEDIKFLMEELKEIQKNIKLGGK